MDLNYTAQEEAFRDEVRAFLHDHLPTRLSQKVSAGQRLTKQDTEEWHAILNRRGWLAADWPVAWGGTGWSIVERHIFAIETALAHTPRILPFGLNMLGPVLIEYGSDAQKAHWLPRILDGSDWWCQGYSEPGAGSDLASLKCAAVRDGDHYVVNGQKTWTTLGQHADMIFCLVRTDPVAKKQEGISFLLIDMNSPGIEVRPIILLDGESEVNEVFFSDVRVPAANLVGEENRGWTYAKFLLTHERSNIAGLGASMAALEALKQMARAQLKRGRPLAADPAFAARLARVEIDLQNMKITNLRVLAAVANGGAPIAESSMLKIRGTEIRQEISGLMRRAIGPYAQPFISGALDEGYNGKSIGPDGSASVAADYFNGRKLSIFGGSNEIQREIIAKSILRL
jgi:alkylation response protein AidB-like acyl-CoA dehydrogenase